MTRVALVTALLVALIVPATSAGGVWTSYVGPSAWLSIWGYVGDTSGWNYHKNNRVYRPVGHPFYLDYVTSPGQNYHFSTTNWNDNPFYFAAYGYNKVGCWWEWWNDNSSELYPVTCQHYV